MEYGAFTHTGMVRKINEDYYYIPGKSDINLDIIIVADGMGGHNAGDLASRLAVKATIDYLEKYGLTLDSPESVREIIIESIQHANNEVYNLSRTDERLVGMGTTLTMALFCCGKLFIGHVGDSRGYLLRGDTVSRLTRDHSLVQELLDNGSISEDEMANHPQKNVITRAIGTEQYIKIDFSEFDMHDDDLIMLCTDGLIQHVNIEKRLRDLPDGISLDEIAQLLGQEALDAGGADNITIVLARNSACNGKR